MLNFTVGPVQSTEEICAIGSEQVPYFRTKEFSDLMFENEMLMKKMSSASNDSKVVFITGSGTASMEAVVINTLNREDKVLIVNGGSFGQRFVQLCQMHKIKYTDIKLKVGESLKQEHLDKYKNEKFSALIVNMHETSTGVLYDMELISRFCKEKRLFLIVDAISAFLADDFNMEALAVDVMITGSQKALACPPGISIITISQRAIDRIYAINVPCMYLNLVAALKDAERGQTPFTPAVGILRQINYRLKEIDQNGGYHTEVARIKNIADDFRKKIKNLPFTYISESMSNAVTALHPTDISANELFNQLKDNYNIWVCPNGGTLKDEVFRVGHIGNITTKDNDLLVEAFKDLHKKKLYD